MPKLNSSKYFLAYSFCIKLQTIFYGAILYLLSIGYSSIDQWSSKQDSGTSIWFPNYAWPSPDYTIYLVCTRPKGTEYYCDPTFKLSHFVTALVSNPIETFTALNIHRMTNSKVIDPCHIQSLSQIAVSGNWSAWMKPMLKTLHASQAIYWWNSSAQCRRS